MFKIFLIVLPGTYVAAAQPPNVVVILADDQGWGDLSLSGNTNLSTPHIDSLAADGAQFDRFYVSPVCSPTRAEFLTGRYHQRGGVYGTSAGAERLDLDEETIGDTFKAAGYRTAAFGKWHNGMQYPYHPNGRGFDEFYGFCSGHWGDYFSPMLEYNGKIVKGDGFVVDDFTNRAIGFIEKSGHKPFFILLPYNTPHSPMQVPDVFWKRFKNKEISMRHRNPERENGLHLRAALAMCENIDWNVGRILDTLDELDLVENTIVMYFSDNGPNGARWNGGMRGMKGSVDEGGVRSPLLIRWPAGIKPGTEVKTLSAVIDLFPTLAEMASVPLTSKKQLDGISLAPLLSDTAGGRNLAGRLAGRKIFSAWRNHSSVRTPRYRLTQSGKRNALYDMIADPGQYRDVSAEHPELHAELSQELRDWMSAMRQDLGKETRPFLIGHPGMAWTQLPSRDAIPVGNIERSNRFPNDSFFTNWTSTGDRIVWDAEVEEAGEFEVRIYYTCDPANVGSILELSFGESTLSGQVTKAYGSDLLGAEQDRSPRMESYVQDWTPMTLGKIKLPAGPGKLTLKATEIPGNEVMDFRLLTLKRL
ncbi:N-acetylgalactosamine 6-sulfate sulfatase [Coraliomargarita sinensis]|uniref:N-acetylgalactosamine 6-sulfate sulfatase n=1 Tax=Coraliomargarita sinensis TaxID=2174842 RepID=A0A317ZKZ5_9BACT|nr:N-acetylgalactosamine 6-sulfate sulfatase [Coraliomargarita sinensis]